MPGATPFATQWAGLVALSRLLGAHAPGAEVVEQDGMLACLLPRTPGSSLLNAALTVDPAATPAGLVRLADRYRAAGTTKWGLWLDGGHAQAARAATAQGMVLDSRPTPMVAALRTLPFGEAPACAPVEFGAVGRINDRAYGYAEPKLAPAIAKFPASKVLSYGARLHGSTASVALAFDVGSDTAVWFVATLPQAQGKGLAGDVLRRLLLDARERGQRTASLQASHVGRSLYERLGFAVVGRLHLYEERFR
jgi:ribosomal protein S18 acetylase RimI-like enzyme